jgi:hypothetical protein
MFEYTKDNHLKFDNGVSIGSCSRPVGTFKEECIEAAKLIASKTDKMIYVSYTDLTSQVICHAFTEAGIRFTAVNAIMGRSLNMFQSALAKQFFESMGMRYITMNLDMREYFTKFLPNTHLNNNEEILQAYIQSQLDGVFVSSGSMLLLDRQMSATVEYTKLNSRKFYDGILYNQASLDIQENSIFNYYQNNDKECIPEFFFYTPELLHSIMASPEVKMFVDTSEYINAKNYSIIFKDLILPMLYKKHWNNLTPIPVYDGIELIDEHVSYGKLSNHFNSCLENQKTKSINIPYSELMDHLSNNRSGHWKGVDDEEYFYNFLKNY